EKVHEEEEFTSKMTVSNKAQFKLNGKVNHYYYVLSCRKSTHSCRQGSIYRDSMSGVDCHPGTYLDHSRNGKVHRTQKCLDANGDHFEYLLW
ncbi:hypothetical protein ANN_22497, partial [Periplaneta americana]